MEPQLRRDAISRATTSDLSCSAKEEHPVIANAGFVPKHRWLLGRPLSRTMTAESYRLVPTISLAVPGTLDGAPNPNGRRRHVHVIDAEVPERIDQRLDHRGRRRRDAALAATLDAERIAGGRIERQLHVEARNVVGPRQAVIHERGIDDLPAA